MGRKFRPTLIGRLFAGAAKLKRQGVYPCNAPFGADAKADHGAISIGRRPFVERSCNCEGELFPYPVGHALRARHVLEPFPANSVS